MTVATKIRKGNVVILDGELYTVLKTTHITPGKGNAIVQTDLRNVNSGIKTNKRFRSSEDIETAEVRTSSMQYLYNDSGIYHFMDQASFEQYELTEDFLADASHYILPDNIYEVSVYEGKPIGIELPPRLTLKIIETDPPQKGVQGKTKTAKLESGVVVRVPLFLSEGESVVVNTENDEYIERAK